MVRFYKSKDATEMMEFLVDCHPEAQAIRELNKLPSPNINILTTLQTPTHTNGGDTKYKP
jgi:hypothetical protein